MLDSIAPQRIARGYDTVRAALLDERNAAGYWEGQLSVSALATATAVMALEMVRSDWKGLESRVESREPKNTALLDSGSRLSTLNSRLTPLIDGGLRWLAAHQNGNGGWGDTVKSHSNISTTMLAHAVFHAVGVADDYRDTVETARQYIDRVGGIAAVRARYGKDKTFAIPILTHCALAGLVDWREVDALPFELACLPPQFYKTVRLPVVSYALPALIAIGQVRHHFRKPRNPLFRLIRRLAGDASLRTLERIQPGSGGFLEATPLTSFVTMSLAGMGLSHHRVAQQGVRFIIDSVCDDGGWPIDTNLATWVTTLSVNALTDDLPADDRAAVRDWLLGQQYREVHPYTNSDPGGWAWTDLPGGVPDGDDTPGAILALLNLRESSGDYSDEEHEAFSLAVGWLLDLQNSDGGWPTFCRGWGALPFDRSAADITAHAIRALTAWLGHFANSEGWVAGVGTESLERSPQSGTVWWLPAVDPSHPQEGYQRADTPPARLISRVEKAVNKGFDYLARVQRADGSWLPLWFGNQYDLNEENPTYGTARVLAAYRDAGRFDDARARRGLDWLQTAQNEDGGWGGAVGIVSSVEETALAAEILLSTAPEDITAQRSLAWLLECVERGEFRETTPIGFYFAKLWYFEDLYPLTFMVAALGRAFRRLCDSPAIETSKDNRGKLHPQTVSK